MQRKPLGGLHVGSGATGRAGAFILPGSASSALWGPLAPGGPGFVALLGCDAGKAHCAHVPAFFLLCNGNCSEYSCAGVGLCWLVRADH